MSSKNFIDDGNGNVAGIKAVKVEWTKVNGQWKLNEVPDSEQTFEADLILLAMGFLGPEKYCIDQLELPQDNRSNIVTREGTYRTSKAKVYACGDCRRGQSLVVHAINEGRQAAREIDADFNHGVSALPGPGGVVPYPPPGQLIVRQNTVPDS